MTQPNITALDAVVMVQLDIRESNLSGKINVNKDLANTKNLPPKEVMSTGVRHFCDPSKKQAFNTLRKAGARVCNEVGIPLLKGWAIPKEKVKELDEKLRELAMKYCKEADELCANLDAYYKEWEDQFPEWVELLRRDRRSPSEIRRSYVYRHRMYRVRPISDDLDDPFNDDVGLTPGSFLGALLDDMAEQAKALLKRAFEGKNRVSGMVIPSIGVMADKLKSFSLIDPMVVPVVTMIGEALLAINQTNGMLSVVETSALRSLLMVMADPEMVRNHGKLHLQDRQQSSEFEFPLTVKVVEGNTSESLPLFTNPQPETVASTPPIPVEPTADFTAALI